MISEKFSIEEFVDRLNGSDTLDIIATTVDEATQADRLLLKAPQRTDRELLQIYSRQLRQLISYHRYVSKPRRPNSKTYNLYMTYWGTMEQ